LSITTNLFYYYLFRTDETINYKKFRLWFRQNPLYIKSNDETIKNFILPSNPFKNCNFYEYLKNLTYRERERERECVRVCVSVCLCVCKVRATLSFAMARSYNIMCVCVCVCVYTGVEVNGSKGSPSIRELAEVSDVRP
jgi:hypothetical protein